MTPDTPLLDHTAANIRQLVETRGWERLSDHDRIGAAYDFVRNEIAFGYNLRDDLPASRVLKQGYGQCNTKSTLLMALLTRLGIETRLHGFAIHKSLQRGIVPELAYRIAPDEVLHSWVEVRHRGRWVPLEGVIMDEGMVSSLQAAFPERRSLCAYGVGTDCLPAPEIGWTGAPTYIQKTGIIRDFGLFETPDAFYARHGQDRGILRESLFRYVVRHLMNRRLREMRAGGLPEIPTGPDEAPAHRIYKESDQDAA